MSQIGFKADYMQQREMVIHTDEPEEKRISPEERSRIVRDLLREEGFELAVEYLRQFMMDGKHREELLVQKFYAIKQRYFERI